MTDFDVLGQGYASHIRELAEQTRSLVLSVQPQAHQQVETSWGGYLLFKQVAGAGNTVCWISLHQKHVSLGFPSGTELSDPSRLLQGTGKRQRHVKLKSVADVENPALRVLIQEAWATQPDAQTLQQALAKIREICLALPGSQEKLAHGHPTFFRGKKSYAVYGIYSPSIAFKPEPAAGLSLCEDNRFFPTPYLAHQGWISLRLEENTDWDEVTRLLEGSYRQTLPH